MAAFFIIILNRINNTIHRKRIKGNTNMGIHFFTSHITSNSFENNYIQ